MKEGDTRPLTMRTGGRLLHRLDVGEGQLVDNPKVNWEREQMRRRAKQNLKRLRKYKK